MSDDQRRDAAPPPAAGDSGAASPPADEPFDAIAAVAELEAAMQAADAQQQDSAADSGQHRAQIEARDRQIAELEGDVSALMEELATAKGELGDAHARIERAREEVDAAHARIAREAEKRLERRTHKVLTAFVEIFDDLARALDAARQGEHNPEVIAGLELIERRFLTTLEGFGVRQQQAVDEIFDPTLHEAVTVTAVQDPTQDGRVVAVVRDGYLVGDDTVLRPATVVVGKHE